MAYFTYRRSALTSRPPSRSSPSSASRPPRFRRRRSPRWRSTQRRSPSWPPSTTSRARSTKQRPRWPPQTNSGKFKIVTFLYISSFSYNLKFNILNFLRGSPLLYSMAYICESTTIPEICSKSAGVQKFELFNFRASHIRWNCTTVGLL